MMTKTPHHRDIDEAFSLLRSSKASLSNSFSQELEDRLMKEQVRMSRPTARQVMTPLLLVFGVLIVGGSAISYAAVNGWLPWVISIDEEGTVTDDSGEVVGATYENEDGSTITVIGDPKGVEYRVRTEEPMNGRQLIIGPVGKNGGDTSASSSRQTTRPARDSEGGSSGGLGGSSGRPRGSQD